ncbi:lysine biosynthesis protein LysX [Myceligenerans cantabricum]
MRITPFAILASRVRLEEKQLLEAFTARGADVSVIDPRRLSGGVDDALGSDAVVINREIGHARAYYGAQLLEHHGARVVNTARATRLAGDKWLTSCRLHAAGLPTPPSRLALTPEEAGLAFTELGGTALVKPLVGSWGRLISRLPDKETARSIFEYVAALPSPQSHIVYLQREITGVTRDLRVVVVGGEAVGVISRRAEGWRNNVALGAEPRPEILTPPVAALAVRAAACVGADIAGVDLLEDRDGRLWVIEVNDRVEFKGFQRAHGDQIDLADAFVRLAMSTAERGTPPEPAAPVQVGVTS